MTAAAGGVPWRRGCHHHQRRTPVRHTPHPSIACAPHDSARDNLRFGIRGSARYSLFTDPLLRHAGRCRQTHSNSPFMVLSIYLLTFLSSLQECIMDTRWSPLFVSYLDSPHPFGSCSRFVPDGCASGSPSRTLPGVSSERGPKPSACAATRRPRGEYTVRSCRFLERGGSTGLQA